MAWGFHKNLGKCTSMVVEYWVVLVGLEFAWNKNFKKNIMQIDNKSVVDSLSGVVMNTDQGSSIVSRIFLLLQKFDEVIFKHVFRESNLCVDFMAKLVVRILGWMFSLLSSRNSLSLIVLCLLLSV